MIFSVYFQYIFSILHDIFQYTILSVIQKEDHLLTQSHSQTVLLHVSGNETNLLHMVLINYFFPLSQFSLLADGCLFVMFLYSVRAYWSTMPLSSLAARCWALCSWWWGGSWWRGSLQSKTRCSRKRGRLLLHTSPSERERGNVCVCVCVVIATLCKIMHTRVSTMYLL